MFITFEGPEGAGKSTQATILADYLALWTAVVQVREPGGTPFGDELRATLLQSHKGVPAIAEAFLIAASRAALVHQVIRPALADGKIVVCDRYVDTTLAIQGYGMGVSLALLREVNGHATEGLVPDLTILLDLPAVQGVERKRKQGGDQYNLLDERALELGERYRRGYRQLMLIDPSRWLYIDAAQGENTIRQTIQWHVLGHPKFTSYITRRHQENRLALTKKDKIDANFIEASELRPQLQDTEESRSARGDPEAA